MRDNFWNLAQLVVLTVGVFILVTIARDVEQVKRMGQQNEHALSQIANQQREHAAAFLDRLSKLRRPAGEGRSIGTAPVGSEPSK